jgi:uncharacterized protein (DUF2147 family)
MRQVFVAILLGTLGASVASADEMGGEWSRGDGAARVRIASCGKDVCATNTWIRPGTPREKTGDRLVMSIKPSGKGAYAGSAFDPQRNLTYKISVSVQGDSMTTRGCIVAGLICKGVNWKRVGS